MASYLSQDARKKLEMVRGIKAETAKFHFAPPDTGPVNVPELSRTLWSLQGFLGLATEMIKDDPKLVGQLTSLKDSINDFRREILAGGPVVAERLADYQRALFADIQQTFASLQNQDDRGALQVIDLPPALRHRFVGITGKYLLQVYPKEDVWQRENQRRFIEEIRSVYPDVTGTPVQLLEYTSLLKRSYEIAAIYALIAIAIMVLIHFRSILCMVLALLPVAIGTIWMLGLMGWRGIPFNPANIMTLPLVIGIGVTNGIQILNRFAEEGHPGIFSKSTGKAVLVSGLTAITGFGSLILAKHRGISSLGFVMAVGLSTCMLAALTFLPALLKLLMDWGWKVKNPSADNARPALGSEEPR